MTKSNLINRMCEAWKVSTGRSEQIVNAIFDSIEQALNRGERVEIRGFGSFEVRAYRGYVGRNPRTGSTVQVKPKRLAFFKVGKELKDRVQSAALRARRARATELSDVQAEAAMADAPGATPTVDDGAAAGLAQTANQSATTPSRLFVSG